MTCNEPDEHSSSKLSSGYISKSALTIYEDDDGAIHEAQMANFAVDGPRVSTDFELGTVEAHSRDNRLMLILRDFEYE